jgi:hypothetical protein
LAPILSFWISLRVLLKVGQPPHSLTGSVLFGVHLLNLFAWFMLFILAALGQLH